MYNTNESKINSTHEHERPHLNTAKLVTLYNMGWQAIRGIFRYALFHETVGLVVIFSSSSSVTNVSVYLPLSAFKTQEVNIKLAVPYAAATTNPMAATLNANFHHFCTKKHAPCDTR